MEKDPIEQAEEVLNKASRDLAAEQTKAHAEMILLASLNQRHFLQGSMLATATVQGIEYVSGLLVAIGLTARNWGRLLAQEPELDFIKYINPEAEALCNATEDGFAHYLCEQILAIKRVSQADSIRQEMADWTKVHSHEEWGKTIVHFISLNTELLDLVMDVRNGTYQPEGEEG